MPFRYNLQSVLRLHRGLERQEEQRLFGAAAIVAKLRADIEHLETNYFDQKRQALQGLSSVSSGATLQFIAVCDASYARTRQALQAQLAQAEKKRMERLEIYKLARQKRETFEGLRDRQEESYNLELTRHEQQRTDETFLLRQFSNAVEQNLPIYRAKLAQFIANRS